MIFTGEIENELHEILYFVENHKDELKLNEKAELANMVAKATLRIRTEYGLTSIVYTPAEVNAAREIIERNVKKDGR
jgi:hypothetical protein